MGEFVFTASYNSGAEDGGVGGVALRSFVVRGLWQDAGTELTQECTLGQNRGSHGHTNVPFRQFLS